MNEFISMQQVSDYYLPITKAWLEDNKGKNTRKRISLYHYTSTEVLDKILTNAAFWASNIFYLNDSSEFKAGLEEIRKQFRKKGATYDIIKQYLDEIEKYDSKNWAGIFTISFSTSSDDLNQWTTYAKESGICIELDCNIVKKYDWRNPKLLIKQKSLNNEYLEASENYNGFGNMEYGEDEDYKLADEIFDSFVEHWNGLERQNKYVTIEEKNELWKQKSHEAKQYLALRASYLKVKGFSKEQEVRISFFPIYRGEAVSGKEEKAKIKYTRLKSGILRPYLEIYFFQGMDKQPKCPIKSIRVGPSGRQQNVYDSIVHRIRYGEINVWKYSLREKFNRLKQYIEGCIETYELNPIKEKVVVNRIYYFLAHDWCAECTEVKFKQQKATEETKAYIELSGETIKHYFYDDEENAYKRAEEYVEKYKREAFLSSHGILINKSTIPYIY